MTSHIIETEDGPVDLTKIETVYGLLPEEVQKSLMACDCVEYYYDGVWWQVGGRSRLNRNHAYRAKRMPPTKPSIDWSQVNPRFKWLARDNDCDSCYLYEDEPILKDWSWRSSTGWECRAEVFASLTLGPCAWKDSLVKRPEGV